MISKFKSLEGLKTIRAGIIPYSIINNNLYFLLGVDDRTKEITDFGGGVKFYEDCIRGAIREFKEESCGFLPKDNYDPTTDKYINSVCLTDRRKMTMIFIRIDPIWFEKATDKFLETKKVSTLKYFEIEKVLWFSENQFRRMISGYEMGYFSSNNKIMWDKISNFLKPVNNDAFFNMLKTKV